MSSERLDLGAGRAFLAGGGRMGAGMRSFDWSSHPLGAPEAWPQGLKSAIAIMLGSRYPMFVWWGRELTNFYNDAYIPTLGARHPQALGEPARRVWADIWSVVGPEAEAVLDEGRATWNESVLLVMERYGYTEETYFTWSYSPAPDDAGGIGGVFCACSEDTVRVLAERRVRALRELAATAVEARAAEEACRLAAEVLGRHDRDVSFSLLYLLDARGRSARLAGASGIARDHPCAPALVELGGPGDPWRLRPVLESGAAEVLADLDAAWSLPGGPWPEPARTAAVLPLVRRAEARPWGFLVLGASPRRAFDDAYRGFFDLVAGSVASNIANAEAHAEEKRRAEALAEVDRSKTAFFSNVSHEFRTPLTLMLGPLEEALARAEGDTLLGAREAVQVAHRNGLRLLKLVNTLLDFSRIEAGRVQARFVPTDLARATAELASVFRSAIERAGMALEVDCPPLPEEVYVDRDMWEKVVLNLLSNAFKFTFEGRIGVSLACDGDAALLRVSDTGVGIPAEELQNLFKRFHRVQGARGRTHEGSGIGLALVAELVQLHGGRLDVESELGRGTTFSVRIPRGMAHLPRESVGEGPPLTAAAPRPDLARELAAWLPEERPAGPAPRGSGAGLSGRVLLADDNADMRDYLRRLLLEQGFEVEAVAGGEEALAAARARPPDLVLADVMMPGLDGFGLLRELRGSPATASLPIVMLSARAGEEARIEGLTAGADDYLIKPFSARELLARVEAQLKLARVRREAHEALQESEERLQALVSQATAGVARTDLNGRFTLVNDRFCDIVGYAREELHSGMRIQDIAHAEDLPRNAELFEALARGGPSYVLEQRYVRKDGTDVWVSSNVGGVRDGDGRLHSVLAVVIDVTERKRALETMGTLAAIVESSADAIISTDLDGVIHSWNAAAERLFGYAAREVVGRPFTLLLPPGREDEGRELLARIRRGERRDHYETVRRRKDGTLLDLSLTASPILDPRGRIVGVSNIGRDITERKRAEEALRYRTEQFETLLNQAPIGVYLLDAELRIREVNPVALPVFGPIPGGVVGRDFGEILRILWEPGYADELLGIFRRTLETGETYVSSERGERRADRGVVEHYQWRLDRIKLPDGVYGLVCYFRDVSEYAQAKAERQRLLDAERDARMTADRANRVKDEFLATLSHELRSPMNAVLTWLHLMQLRPLDPEITSQGLAAMDRGIRTQVQLIDDLLDLNRIVSGKLRIEIQPVDLEAVVQSAIETVQPTAQTQQITLLRVAEAKDLAVRGDSTRLQQVFWNLLSNAIKFTPKGGRIEVRLRRVGSEVRVSVTDTGQGIPPEVLPHVFERFRQADSSTTRRHGGLGLGLAIVKHLVELHGGSVLAESEGQDRGSRFTVALPADVHAPPAEGGPKAPILPDEIDLSGVRVLLVDDDVGTLAAIGRTLREYQAQVRTASGADEALRRLDETLPDVLISDISMPEKDGYELIREVRAHPRTKGLPAVALTALARSDDRILALQAGYSMHVAKPADPRELLAVVAAAVRDGARTRRPQR